MVPSMGTMERLYSPKINNVAVVFNFNTIFYVRSRSEEISPRGSVPQKSTPKYKRLTLKEFQLLKSTNSKKTTTKSTGVRFSTLSTTFTTDSGRKPSQSLDLRNSHETAFSKTFVQAPHQHSKTSSFA